MFWIHDQRGIFTVKSAYNVTWQAHIQRKVDQQDAEYTSYYALKAHEQLWKKIWKVKTLLKIKVFMWCVCRRSLPSKDRLRDKGVITPDSCYLCTDGIETLHHLFLECLYMLNFMEGVGFQNYPDLFVGNSWLDRVANGFGSLNNKELTTLFTLWHAVWSTRNDI